MNSEFSRTYPSPANWHVPAAADPTGQRSGYANRAGYSSLSNRSVRNISTNLKFEDGGVVTYTAPVENAVTVVRSQEAIPPDCPVYMYEVELLRVSEQPNASRIAVGLQFTENTLTRLPGIDRFSLGVHGDNGMLHAGTSDGQPFLNFTVGDTIGVCVNRVEQTVSYAKNGIYRGCALGGLPQRSLYPCVGFDTGDACVRVNFGQQAFKHKSVLTAMQLEVRALVASQVREFPEGGEGGGERELISGAGLKIVLDHLRHSCCWKTAQVMSQVLQKRLESAGVGQEQQLSHAASQQGLEVTADEVETMCQRQKISELLLNGQVKEARKHIEAFAAGLEAEHASMRFALNLQHFIELLRDAKSTEKQLAAVAFARVALQEDAHAPREQADLRSEALTLLAFPDPLASPSAHLFSDEVRQRCAHIVNGALMQWSGHEQCSKLETLYKHAALVHQHMVKNEEASAQLISVDTIIRNGLGTGFDLAPTEVQDSNCDDMEE